MNVISAEQLQMLTNPSDLQYKKVQWHKNMTLYVRQFLPFREMLDLIDAIVSSGLSKDGSTFLPELVDFSTRLYITSTYAAVELPKDTDAQYRVLYTTDLYETVCKNINQSQLSTILKCIDLAVSKMMT